MKPLMRTLVELNDYYSLEGITFVGLFGSQARNEALPTSDIDILIQYQEPKSFFELARIQQKIEQHTGKKVDLVTQKNIKPLLREAIEQDLIPIYGKE